MESLYKSKGKFGLTRREKRRESVKISAKVKRDNIIAARRNIPDLDVSSKFQY